MENRSNQNQQSLNFNDLMVGSEVEFGMYRAQIKTLQKTLKEHMVLYKKQKKENDAIQKEQDAELKRLDEEEKLLKKLMSNIKAADAKIDKEIGQYKKLDSHLSKKLSEENKKIEDLQRELENLNAGDWEDLEDWHTDNSDLELDQNLSKNSLMKSSRISKKSSAGRSRNSRDSRMARDSNFGFIFPGQNKSLRTSQRQNRSRNDLRQDRSHRNDSRNRGVNESLSLVDSQESLNLAIEKESQMGDKTLDELADISTEHQMHPEHLSPRAPLCQTKKLKRKSKRRY